MKKILVLGSKGQLGSCLNDQLRNTKYEVVYTSRGQIDVTDFNETKIKIIEIAPDIVINTAAFTEVDKAEQKKEKSNLINNLAVKNIAEICNYINSWLFHISTDYVFDGASSVAYKEDSETSPQCIYGLTKLEGESAIKSSGCKYIIIRTAWVYSEYGNNFLKTMLRLGIERDELSIVNDQIGCPTYAQDIAKAIVAILPQLNRKVESGVYHYCGDHACSWYDFAKEIFKASEMLNGSTKTSVYPLKTSEYHTLAERPMYSVLNCSKITQDFGIRPPKSFKKIESIVKLLHGKKIK